MNYLNQFPKRLKQLRLDNNLTQTQLAQQSGMITQAGIAKWETGDRTPSLDCLIALAQFFNCSLDYLVGLED